MKNIFYPLILAFFCLIFQGCEDDGINSRTIDGEGAVVTEILELDSFDKINNTGVANFYVTIGSYQSVALKAQQNIIDVMTVNVSGETLNVGLEKGVSLGKHEEIRFEITVPSFSAIDLTGVGDFILSGEDQDELTVRLTGVGNVRAFDMTVGTCSITTTGVGDCEVSVTDALDVTITGIGIVYYKGDPSLHTEITGIGDVIDADP
jgi:hypothetical protein